MADRRNAGRTENNAVAAAAGPGGKDRFEDHVLELLLSFLPSQEAVRTCVLAKRWRHIWKSVASLSIDTEEFETTKDFKCFVNTLIELRDPTVPLHVCEISAYGGKDDGEDGLESWLQYAVSCLINFGVIRAKSLRHLRIKDSVFYPGNIRTRISAPGLVTCELSDCFTLTPLFGKLPSVITAFIRIRMVSEEKCCEDDYCEGFCCQDDCSVLLEGLSGATNLELICDDRTMIFHKDLKWRPTFGKLKTVLLNGWCVADNFTGLIYFLQHSPILERLTLQLSPSLESFSEVLESYSPREHFLLSKHLKVVEIKHYKVKSIQICQIVKLLGTLGVTRETIHIDDNFLFDDWFSFDQKKYEETSMSQS